MDGSNADAVVHSKVDGDMQGTAGALAEPSLRQRPSWKLTRRYAADNFLI